VRLGCELQLQDDLMHAKGIWEGADALIAMQHSPYGAPRRVACHQWH
jgi:hypothetical protein